MRSIVPFTLLAFAAAPLAAQDAQGAFVVTLGHDTLRRNAAGIPFGFGLARIVHALPSQRSVNVLLTALLSTSLPV